MKFDCSRFATVISVLKIALSVFVVESFDLNDFRLSGVFDFIFTQSSSFVCQFETTSGSLLRLVFC